MSVATLLKSFDLLATAPSGVARLRELILTLAVQGKLVPQDPKEGPARKSIESIRAARERRVSRKDTDNEPLDEPDEASRSSDSPLGWVWVQLGEVVEVLDSLRKPVKKEDRKPGPYPYYGASGVVDYVAAYIFDEPLVLVGEDGAKWGAGDKTAFSISGKAWVNNHAHVLRPNRTCVEDMFLVHVLTAMDLSRFITGMTVPKLNQARLVSIPFALPPLAEQKRIVARVEELMKLCDTLEQNGRLADEQHARLTSTLFDALTASGSAHALAGNWQRVADNFDLLLDRPEAVDALEQTILQLAVRGLLVSQDQNDESVPSLLNRIRIDRKLRSTQGRSKTEKELEPVGEIDRHFEVPGGWSWVRLNQVAESRLGKMLDKAKNTGSLRPYLRNTNVQWRSFNLNDIKSLRLESHELDTYRLHYGDLLVCEGGEPGRCAIWRDADIEMYFQKAIHRVTPLGGIMAEYIEICLEQDARAGGLDKYLTGATIKHFAGQELNRYALPMPPVNEQHRIVSRVESLRRLCSDLRQRLTAARDRHDQLAQVLIEQQTASAV